MAGILGLFTVLALILTRDYGYMKTDEDMEQTHIIETDSTKAKPAESGEPNRNYTSFWSGMKHLDIQFMCLTQAVTPVAGLIMLTTITLCSIHLDIFI